MASGVPSHKIVLCGEYGVGKSSIFRRFVDNSYTVETGPRSTLGLDHYGKEFQFKGQDALKIELWDTAGIERFATLSASYFQSASAAILCYALDNRESFNVLSQHMLDIIMNSRAPKIFLCGNKSDLDIPPDEGITDKDIEDFRAQCDTVLSASYKISCKSGEGVKEMFEHIAHIIVQEAELKFDPSKIQPTNAGSQLEDKPCCKNS